MSQWQTDCEKHNVLDVTVVEEKLYKYNQHTKINNNNDKDNLCLKAMSILNNKML